MSMDAPISSVDWLTLSIVDEATREECRGWALRHRAEQENLGERSISMLSYGYQGFRVAGMTWGTRSDGDLFMMAGAEAERHWPRLSRLQARCSRIDLAVTQPLAIPNPELAREAYKALLPHLTTVPQKSNRLLENSAGGMTLYLGSRSSEKFARLYDKSAQARHGPLGSLWRYEVEFKSHVANGVWRDLTVIPNRAMVISATVHQFFKSRGVEPVWALGAEAITPQAERRVKAVDTRLAWLRSQVSPTIAYLKECGYGQAMREALGLEDD